MEAQILKDLKEIYTEVERYLSVRTTANTSKTNKTTLNAFESFMFPNLFISDNIYSELNMHSLTLNNLDASFSFQIHKLKNCTPKSPVPIENQERFQESLGDDLQN